MYARLESNFYLPIEGAKRTKGAHVNSSMEEADLIKKVNQLDETASHENMIIRETVEMVPQEEIRSEHDLGFMTEVDAEFTNKVAAGKESHNTEGVISTRHSEVEGNTSMPVNRSSMQELEHAEFQQVIKEIVSKEQTD